MPLLRNCEVCIYFDHKKVEISGYPFKLCIFEHLKNGTMSNLITNGKFKYAEIGQGEPLVLLHGLFGELSNFEDTIAYFSTKYRVITPIMPLYTMPIITTSVGALAKYVEQFINHMGLTNINLLGNSLGGHVALVYTEKNSHKVKNLILTGSSGLYENAFGGGFPRREDKEFLRDRIKLTFYDPKFVTDELVDRCHSLVNTRNEVIRILKLAKSAIRHNMEKELPNFTMPTLLIWGKQDNITPPHVAEQFNELLPNATLEWIDKCGHAPMMEQPQQFNSILNSWLEKHS